MNSSDSQDFKSCLEAAEVRPRRTHLLASATLFALAFGWITGCRDEGQPPSPVAAPPGPRPPTPSLFQPTSCLLVPEGEPGPKGNTRLQAAPLVTGLEVPWEVAILPGSRDWLVTERPGRLRLIRDGNLVPSPVMTVSTVSQGEGGLLGLTLDPSFPENSRFYVYLSTSQGGGTVNRVQQYELSADHLRAEAGPIVLDQIPGGTVHNGGRIRFGGDGALYVSTGEGSDANLPRDASSLGGKILKLSRDPASPTGFSHSVFAQGLRNPQGFDFLDSDTLIAADNGPTGEYQGRTGGDKLAVLHHGQDLGWPTIWHCETQPGLISPILTWTDALPPGGLLIYRGIGLPGARISDWTVPDGNINLLIASTGGKELHRVLLDASGNVSLHESYLRDSLGRLRSAFQAEDGSLYVTTSNCDGRGTCPSQKDGIYRISAGN